MKRPTTDTITIAVVGEAHKGPSEDEEEDEEAAAAEGIIVHSMEETEEEEGEKEGETVRNTSCQGVGEGVVVVVEGEEASTAVVPGLCQWTR